MDETDPLRWFLTAQRTSVLAIVEGLRPDQMTTAALPSGWTPLGLLQHLAGAERYWFQVVVAGQAEPPPWPIDQVGDAAFTSERTIEEVVSLYRDQIARADAILDSRDEGTLLARAHGIDGLEEFPDLRWVVLHMIEETARHAGHLDAARELIDGRTGLGPR